MRFGRMFHNQSPNKPLGADQPMPSAKPTPTMTKPATAATAFESMAPTMAAGLGPSQHPGIPGTQMLPNKPFSALTQSPSIYQDALANLPRALRNRLGNMNYSGLPLYPWQNKWKQLLAM